MPCAKVIDGDGYTHVTESLQHTHHSLRIFHHSAFGDFNAECATWQIIVF